jgi:octaheme c-type cytochrome (tetrathionate reductase family)
MLSKRLAIILTIVLLTGLALGATLNFGRVDRADREAPWSRMPKRPAPTDHTHLIQGPFEDGPSVTKACLECHPDAARHVMATSHWTWLGQEARVPGHPVPVRVGKKNLINNFCVGVQSNWARCTSCHAGYGWADDTFDFSNRENVDCLVCHDRSGTYQKAPEAAGHPAEGVDLLAAARSVGPPTRENCGYCHFRGGGGDAVKHGDLDGSMYFPPERVDVHMGKYDFSCQDCHRTDKHNIQGRAMSASIENNNRISCTDCHAEMPHGDERLDSHTQAVACQTCHIPKMAVAAATKMTWDWSTAGQDLLVDDPQLYNMKKGSFTFAKNVNPEYYWYNGSAGRYLQGDRIDPHGITQINAPLGNIHDPTAKIWPFKVHRGKQIYDAVHRHLLVPKVYGEGGYWTTFNWDHAVRLGCEATGLDYSGQYDFAPTEMYWPLTHMVAAKDKALQCTDCHGEDGRMDWYSLGYVDDPAFRGGRLNTEAFGRVDTGEEE